MCWAMTSKQLQGLQHRCLTALNDVMYLHGIRFCAYACKLKVGYLIQCCFMVMQVCIPTYTTPTMVNNVIQQQ